LACYKLELLKCAAEFIELFHQLRVLFNGFRFEALDVSETVFEDAIDAALTCI
jgi:CMP-2-keto-3-deoxyoctulosonic acid synthetase